MTDSSILARECAPEEQGVTPSIRISDLWAWTLEAVQRSPRASESLIDRWARRDYRERPTWREQYGLTSVAHELMSRGLREGDFALRVHDGTRAWRLPLGAFAAWGPDTDLEMTWTGGRLWEPDASSAFRAIARLELPLLTTEAEAEVHRRRTLKEIADIERSASRPPSDLRRTLQVQIRAAEKAVDEPDPARQRAWVEEWSARVRWPLREALLWIALRDLDEVAKTELTSFWAGNEDLGLAGAALATCDIEGQSDWRRVVENDSGPRLMRALKGTLRAIGLFEGVGPVRLIEGQQWENLKFGVPPSSQRGTSDAWQSAACESDQIPGRVWRGYWTGILIEREDIFTAFPPIPIGSDADDSDAAVDATIRRLSAERGSPLPRNGGKKIVQGYHPSRSLSHIRKRIETVFPGERPGPKGPRTKPAA